MICTELPGLRFCDPHGLPAVREPVYLGIQHRREVIEQVPADRRTVVFHPEFRVSRNSDGTPNFLGPYAQEFRVSRNSDGTPNFLGPYAQGSPTDRFIYLSWGVKQTDGRFEMFRRLKLRLGHLTWDQIERSVAKGQPIAVRLRLTDARGSPLCATPPPTNVRWEL